MDSTSRNGKGLLAFTCMCMYVHINTHRHTFMSIGHGCYIIIFHGTHTNPSWVITIHPASRLLGPVYTVWACPSASSASLNLLDFPRDACLLCLLVVDSRWRLVPDLRRWLSRKPGSVPAQEAYWHSSSKYANPDGEARHWVQ